MPRAAIEGEMDEQQRAAPVLFTIHVPNYVIHLF